MSQIVESIYLQIKIQNHQTLNKTSMSYTNTKEPRLGMCNLTTKADKGDTSEVVPSLFLVMVMSGLDGVHE